MPNVFFALARRPDEFRAFFAYHDALMEKPGGLTKAEREMIVVATSAANQCHYCVVAHGAILRIRAKNPLIADQVAINHRKADITPRSTRCSISRLKVASRSHEVDDADFVALQEHGSRRRTSGTSPPSPLSSPCRTDWRTSPASGRTTSLTSRGGCEDLT